MLAQTLLRQLFRTVTVFTMPLLLCSACKTVNPRSGAADSRRGYTADMVFSAGGATTTSHIMLQGSRMRVETLSGRRSSVLLVDYGRLLAWVLIPAEGKYTEVPFETLGDQIPHFFMPGLQIDKKRIREEEINGTLAVHYRAVIVCDEGQGYSGSLWESRDLQGFPLKWVDDASKAMVTWRNVREAELPSSLFALPAGYTELAGEIRIDAGRGKRSCRNVKP